VLKMDLCDEMSCAVACTIQSVELYDDKVLRGMASSPISSFSHSLIPLLPQ
jgi:hypothetical protein